MNTIHLVPDASVALAWLLDRVDVHESLLARHLLEVAHGSHNTVPPIWRVEVANGVLRACLATFDRKLADAARASGVTVFGQPHGVAEPAARYLSQ